MKQIYQKCEATSLKRGSEASMKPKKIETSMKSKLSRKVKQL